MVAIWLRHQYVNALYILYMLHMLRSLCVSTPCFGRESVDLISYSCPPHRPAVFGQSTNWQDGWFKWHGGGLPRRILSWSVTSTHTHTHTYIYIYIYMFVVVILIIGNRQAIFNLKGDKLSSLTECGIRTRVSGTKSPAELMPTDKPTELSRNKKTLEFKRPSPWLASIQPTEYIYIYI